MRRLCITVVVAAAAVLVPTWTWAGNQEVAEQIAASLRESGQLQGYKVGVKFQDGTAWLKGQVSSPEQMNTALRLANQTPGVVRVVNNLTVSGQAPLETNRAEMSAPAADSSPRQSQNPLTQALRILQPTSSAQGLQQTNGAVAPERFAAASPASSGLYAEGNTRSAQQLQNARVSRLPAAPKAQRVPTTFAQGAVQPTGAMAASAQDQRMPLAIAYTQAPVPEGTEAGAAPQPIPAPPQPVPAGGAPQPMPAGAPQPMPQYGGPVPSGAMPAARYDQPYLPNYAWPGYTAYPNYAGVSYPKQYSPMAWPYIGPFYPYPQAPLGWRKVTLQWHDGWWFLDFDDCSSHGWFSGLFRHHE